MKTIEKLPNGYVKIVFDKSEMITTTKNWSEILKGERRRKLNYIKYNYE